MYNIIIILYISCYYDNDNDNNNNNNKQVTT